MKIAMIFPGYSSQFVGMAKELYDEYRIVQEYFEEASNCLPTNFVKLCFASSDAELARMEFAYPATFLVSCAIVSLLKEQGIIPDAVAGYNQGEFAAMFAANCITFPDGLYLLTKYSSFYQEALADMDAAIVRIQGLTTRDLRDLCLKAKTDGDVPAIAIYLTENLHLVSGKSESIEKLRDLILETSPHTKIDHVGLEVGLHSPLMNGVETQFKIYLEKVDFKDTQIPVIAGIDGRALQEGSQLKELIMRHINSPVIWTQVVDILAQYDVIIEIGPGSKLSEMIKNTYPEKQVLSINKKADIEQLKELMPKPASGSDEDAADNNEAKDATKKTTDEDPQ